MAKEFLSAEELLAIAKKNSGGGGTGDGDMKKSVYDKNNNGIVDNAEKVNNHTVEKDVPANAQFTDTVYDDTILSGRVTDLETEVALKADKSELPDVATASDVGLVKPDGSSITVDANGVLTAVGGGSGNTKLKTRYSISYSSWSSSPNSDGYYTYSLTLSPTLDTTVSPDVLIAGSSNTSQPTDTHKTMFGYVERCYLSGSSLTLYAKTKPTSTFYIWVEGVAGSGSGSIVGNVIQPNGASGGNPFNNPEVLFTKTFTIANLDSSNMYYQSLTSAQISAIYACKALLFEVNKYNASGVLTKVGSMIVPDVSYGLSNSLIAEIEHDVDYVSGDNLRTDSQLRINDGSLSDIKVMFRCNQAYKDYQWASGHTWEFKAYKLS